MVEYLPKQDEWAPALALLYRFSFEDSDTTLVSAEEFDAFVTALRARHHGLSKEQA